MDALTSDMAALRRFDLVGLHLDGLTIDDIAELTGRDPGDVLGLLAEAQRCGEWTAYQATRFAELTRHGRTVAQAKQEAKTWPRHRNWAELCAQAYALQSQGVSMRWIAEWAGRTTVDIARAVVDASKTYEAIDAHAVREACEAARRDAGAPVPNQRSGGRVRASGTPSAATPKRSRRGPTRKRSR